MTFPNKILLTIAIVLPVSTATVERSFSDMKQIKDRLHNRLLPASMFKLMIIAIEKPPLHEVDLCSAGFAEGNEATETAYII